MTSHQRRDMDLRPVDPRRLEPARQSNIWERRKRCEIAEPVYSINPHPQVLIRERCHFEISKKVFAP